MSQSKRGDRAYHLLGEQGKRANAIGPGPEIRVHTVDASDPEKGTEEGFYSSVAYLKYSL